MAKGVKGSEKGVKGNEKGVKGSEKGVKGSERTILHAQTFVPSLPFTPLHSLSLPKNNLLSLLVLLLLPAFHSHAQEADSSRLRLTVENHHFFRNNEYAGERLDGYTLPGFYLRPQLQWQVESRVRLSAGMHWLHYWGAHRYPSNRSYADRPLPVHSDTTTAVHLLPWVQARVDFNPTVSLILGSLESRDGHGLPQPLFEPELRYAADPEAGAQLLVQRPWMDLDLWVNWHEFIFAQSDHQERFYIGLSTQFRLPLGDWTLRLPLYAIATHYGGESLTVYLRNHHQANYAGGLGVDWTQGDLGTGLEVLALGYIQRKGSIHPYDNGWGIYPTLSLRYREAGLRLSYWHGEGFIPILGSPLFSNASANTDDLTIDRNRLLTLRLDYRWRRFKACEVTLEGELHHCLPWTGDRPGYSKVERDGRTLFGFGIHVKLNPSITLLR